MSNPRDEPPQEREPREPFDAALLRIAAECMWLDWDTRTPTVNNTAELVNPPSCRNSQEETVNCPSAAPSVTNAEIGGACDVLRQSGAFDR